MELPISLSATNNSGKYREIGAIYIHVVGVAAINAASGIRARADALRAGIRGQNIDGIRIESITPANFNAGATLQFEGGWTGASVIASYETDIDL
jgi:hypothetical protein